MASVYNVFDPDDLELAQSIFDDIWGSLPASVRASPRRREFKEWLAQQVLATVKNNEDPMSYCLKARVMGTDLSVWA